MERRVQPVPTRRAALRQDVHGGELEEVLQGRLLEVGGGAEGGGSRCRRGAPPRGKTVAVANERRPCRGASWRWAAEQRVEAAGAGAARCLEKVIYGSLGSRSSPTAGGYGPVAAVVAP